VKDRLDLLREMLSAAAPTDWDTLRGTFKDGYESALAVIDRWAEMTSAPSAPRPDPIILGDASCTEAP